MDDFDNAILQHMLKLTDGKKITKKDRHIYNIALLEKFEQAFPELFDKSNRGQKQIDEYMSR